MWGARAKFVRWTGNGMRLSEGPRGEFLSVAGTAPPKISARRSARTIALVGGARKVHPPDSEWSQALSGASVCPRRVKGTVAPKIKHPKEGCQRVPAEKGPETGGL